MKMNERNDRLLTEPVTIWAPYTRWRLRRLEGWTGPELEVLLVADSTAPMVVNAIEAAFARRGIELDRLESVS